MNTIRQSLSVTVAIALAFGLHLASAPNLQADEIEVKSVLLRLIAVVFRSEGATFAPRK